MPFRIDGRRIGPQFQLARQLTLISLWSSLDRSEGCVGIGQCIMKWKSGVVERAFTTTRILGRVRSSKSYCTATLHQRRPLERWFVRLGGSFNTQPSPTFLLNAKGSRGVPATFVYLRQLFLWSILPIPNIKDADGSICNFAEHFLAPGLDLSVRLACSAPFKL